MRKRGLAAPIAPGETRVIVIEGPMPAPCKDCPFTSDHMAESLGARRVAGIKAHVARGGFFPCHKTVDHSKEELDENGTPTGHYDIEELLSWKECGGAVEYRKSLVKTND